MISQAVDNDDLTFEIKVPSEQFHTNEELSYY